MAKVFLSAGHGGTDPGATAFGLKEKGINLQIMLACKSELERHGVTVVCSRLRDENDPVAQEVAEANASGAEVAVAFHTNAAKGDGSESYYYSLNEDGKRLAELCEKYTKELGQNSRGAKAGDKLYFIKNTKMLAVLCECAFIDNDTDNDIIDTTAEQQAFGVAYAKAILEYLNISYNSAAPTPAPSKPAASKPVQNNPTGLDAARSYSKSVAGTYQVTAKSGLNIRAGADVSKKSLGVLSYYSTFTCYGYYTNDWLYGVSSSGITGFCSKHYLYKKK